MKRRDIVLDVETESRWVNLIVKIAMTNGHNGKILIIKNHFAILAEGKTQAQ